MKMNCTFEVCCDNGEVRDSFDSKSFFLLAPILFLVFTLFILPFYISSFVCIIVDELLVYSVVGFCSIVTFGLCSVFALKAFAVEPQGQTPARLPSGLLSGQL